MSELLDKLKALLRVDEGERLKPYRDTQGHTTICDGFNLDAHPLSDEMASCLRLTGQLTHDMCETLLDITARAAIKDCEEIFPHYAKWTLNRQAAVADFTFNVGERTVEHGFTSFFRALNAEDWQRAADEIKYVNGLTKAQLSPYWIELHGDRPDSRPARTYKMILEG